MFVRKKRNRSGSTSIQIIDKSYGKYRVIKTIGSACEPDEIDYLWRKAHQLLPDIIGKDIKTG
jgi:hypothetical protein